MRPVRAYSELTLSSPNRPLWPSLYVGPLIVASLKIAMLFTDAEPPKSVADESGVA